MPKHYILSGSVFYNTSSIGLDHRFIVAHDEGMGRVQEAGGVVIKGKYEESLW